MSNTVALVPLNKCTGCSACQNVCPVDAIMMAPDGEGFIMPSVDENKCINCDACYAKCPAVHYEKTNSADPPLYAAMANDEIRSESSSGGMFTLAARAVLAQGGVVCGAAFDENMVLRHCMVSSEAELNKLRGSKYLQSDIGTVYREIKAALESGQKVLFTGTPCQVAGLYNFLGKKYDGLFTIDLICHGVPSQKMFSKYLKEVHGRRKIKRVAMRDKSLGWRGDVIKITSENGEEYVGDAKNDLFEKGFIHNMFLRRSCSNCPFCEFPRCGDISLGDFWGISSFDKDMNDGKGTSMVYVNNEHGAELFELMRPSIMKIKEMQVEHNLIRNRIRALYPANGKRDRFMSLIGRNTMARAFDMAEKDRYDIGIVSNYCAGNFGGSMTQYALYHVLEDMGYSCLMIERPLDAPSGKFKDVIEQIYLEAPYPKYALAPLYKSKKAMRQLNERCDAFVVGSDQLFQYSLFNLMGQFATLDWVADNKQKIAYAASFGHGRIWGDRNIHSEMAYFIRKFDSFSVREESGVKIAKENYGTDAALVIDPVFLCDKKHYYALAKKSTRQLPERYIGGYILDPSKEKGDIFRYAMDKLNIPCEIFSEYNCSKKYTAPLGELNVPDLKTEERLQTIINCDLFITDSFHGTCFSIIMGKPFISIINKARGADRFRTLLKTFRLENRLIESVKDINRPELFEPIDYTEVYKILDKEKDRCLKWLSDAVRVPKAAVYSDYDMMRKLIDEQNAEISRLKALVGGLMAQAGALEYTTKLGAYIDILSQQEKGKLIIISVKDTPGLQLNTDTAKRLQKLGIKTDLCKKHSRSYVAVINNEEIVFEKLGEGLEPVTYRGKVGMYDLNVESRVYKNGNLSVIEFNGTDYSVNRRGLNIAVFDISNGALIDSVAFDTHVAGFDCYRDEI